MRRISNSSLTGHMPIGRGQIQHPCESTEQNHHPWSQEPAEEPAEEQAEEPAQKPGEEPEPAEKPAEEG